MKIVFILFSLFSLSACTVYTVTNKSQKDLRIETTQEFTNLKAGECIELTEYFLGLAGDFPFVIVGEENERNPGHYEITEVKPEGSQEGTAETTESQSTNKSYKVSLSEKNPECTKDEDEDEDEDEETKKEPKPETTEAKKWTEDQQKNAFCLSGQPACSEGTVKCIKKEGISSAEPACVRGEVQTSSKVVCSPATVNSTSNKAQCLFPVSVNVVNQQPLCSGATAECSSGGRVVCGKAPGDSQNKAYCVNAEGIRWTGAVTCTNGTTPSCSGTPI